MYLISAFVITLFSLFALKPVANRVGLIDIPGGRKQHLNPTPLVGGLGIYFSTLAVSYFTPQLWAAHGPMLLVSALVVFIGIFDDLHELRVSLRMSAHLIAAWIMAVWAGNQLSSLGDILGTGPLQLGILTLPLTLFATVGVINAINMADGVDGLCGSMVLAVLTWLGITAFIDGNAAMTNIILVLGCGILAFLTLNFRLPWGKNALIYLGDTGSTTLGFILAWLVIHATQSPASTMTPVLALWLLALPLIDTVSLLLLRPLVFGTSPFSAGTDHLHHRLLRAGYSRKQVVAMMFSLQLLLGGIGFAGWRYQVPESVMFAGFMILFSVYIAWNYHHQRLHKAEVTSA